MDVTQIFIVQNCVKLVEEGHWPELAAVRDLKNSSRRQKKVKQLDAKFGTNEKLYAICILYQDKARLTF